MNWTPAFRGGDSLYAESIYTKRWEILGNYQLPLKEKVMFQFSVNGHDQNSVYGTTFYLANQKIGFSQLTWNTAHGAHDVVTGVALRYTWYDDNTPATYDNHGDRNSPSGIWLPGVFIQDEIRLNARNKVLLGIRYDHNSIHGNIFTPRLNYKWNSENKNDVLRFSIGNGYRVANVFTEDHAALTGARNVIFLEALKPETSWNTNLNYTKLITTNYGFMNVDATAFYTYFDNKIIPDYTTNENEIIYRNLDGHAVSRGISVNLDMSFSNGLKVIAGGTMMEVYSVNQHGVRVRQMLTENFTAVWSVSYPIKKIGVTVDYTGNLYGPMKLPVLGELDPRQKESPWWSIQNIQLTKALGSTLEVYGGVKNLLNFTPPPNSIARSHDPFDKNVVFDGNGKPVPTTENPYAMTFDPSYVFAPNQGMRFFLGLRYQLSR